MASLKDVNWGAIIIGAAAVTAIAAVAMTSAGFLGVSVAAVPLLTENAGLTLTGAALAGGAIGNKVANLFHRGQDAATTLVGR